MSVLFENTVRGTLNGLCFIIWSSHKCSRLPTRQQDVVTTSLCTSQWRRRYVSNETPNDVSVGHCQDVSVVCLKQVSNETPNDVSVVRHKDVSVVRLHNVLLVCRDDVPWGRNDDVPSVRLHDISDKSQMKHPITSQCYVTKMSQWYVFITSH